MDIEPREEWMVKPPEQILYLLIMWMKHTQSGTAMFDGKVTKGVTIYELMEKMCPDLAVLVAGWEEMR